MIRELNFETSDGRILGLTLCIDCRSADGSGLTSRIESVTDETGSPVALSELTALTASDAERLARACAVLAQEAAAEAYAEFQAGYEEFLRELAEDR